MSKTKLLPIVLLAALLTSAPAVGKPKNFRTLQLLALKEMRETVIAAQKSDDIMLKEMDTVANQLQQVLNQRVRTRGAKPLYMQKREVDTLTRRLARNLGPNPYADNPLLKGQANDNDTVIQARSQSSPSQIQTSSAPSSPAAQIQSGSVSSSTSAKTALTTLLAQSAIAQGDSDSGLAVSNTPDLTPQPSAIKNINVYEKKPVKPLDAPRVALISRPDIWYDVPALRKEIPEGWRAEPGTIQIIHNESDQFLIWGAGIEGRPVFDRDKQRFKVISISVH